MAVLGTVGIVDKGIYNAESIYKKGQFVLHDGSSWLALKDNLKGVTPEEGENWKYLARGYGAELLSLVSAADTSGLLGTEGENVNAQSLLDYIADAVATKLVQKTMLSSQQVNDENMIPTSALVYEMSQQLGVINNNTYSLIDSIPIPEGADLHSSAYTIPGNYSCASNAIAGTLLNSPLNIGFSLKVEKVFGTYIIQTFMPYTGTQIIKRMYSGYNNAWNEVTTYVTNSDLFRYDFTTSLGESSYNKPWLEIKAQYKNLPYDTVCMGRISASSAYQYIGYIIAAGNNYGSFLVHGYGGTLWHVDLSNGSWSYREVTQGNKVGF